MDVVMYQFETLTSPNVQNFVSGTKRFFHQGRGVTDSILELKDYLNFEFFHRNQFLGQNEGKVFVQEAVWIWSSTCSLEVTFKIVGSCSTICVSSWTTKACHVYDSKYYKVMTIVLCDMQSEDAAAHELFWLELNEVMRKNRVENTNFKGFMADNAGANWHAVWKVYRIGDRNDPIEDRERTCLSH